jgi:hypothetical protein
MKFQEVKDVFTKYLYIEEPDYLEVMFSAVLSNRLDSDPVWLLVIGDASVGKSEVIGAIENWEGVVPVGVMTANTLISGHKQGENLLKRLDGRVMTIRDASTFATIDPKHRSHIFSQLRAAFDGSFEKATGMGHQRVKSRFGIIAAGTPVIEKMRSFESALGERFLYYRPRIVIYEGMWEKIRSVSEFSVARKEMAEVTVEYLRYASEKISKDIYVPYNCEYLSECLVRLRASVSRDGYTRDIDFPAEVFEAPARVYKQLCALYTALLYVTDGDEDFSMFVIKRVVADTTPYERLKVIKAINSGIRNFTGLLNAVKVSKRTLASILEDMTQLGILVKEDERTYSLDERLRDVFVIRPIYRI